MFVMMMICFLAYLSPSAFILPKSEVCCSEENPKMLEFGKGELAVHGLHSCLSGIPRVERCRREAKKVGMQESDSHSLEASTLVHVLPRSSKLE